MLLAAAARARPLCSAVAARALRPLSSAGAAIVDADVLAKLSSPLILDVRDPDEVARGKGGPPGRVEGAINVPLNIGGVGQGERRTTAEEFLAKLEEAGVALDADTHYVTHCGGGGRGGKAALILQNLGYSAFNGGGPADVHAAYAYALGMGKTAEDLAVLMTPGVTPGKTAGD